jgi:hypothetical protein
MTEMATTQALTGIIQPDGSTRTEATIDAKHVASSVVHIASLPLDVTVLVMNIMQVALIATIISSLILIIGPLRCHMWEGARNMIPTRNYEQTRYQKNKAVYAI